MPVRTPGGEHPVFGSFGFDRSIVGTEHQTQAGRQHNVAVFSPLAFCNADHHAFGIDVAHFYREGFTDAQAGSVTEHQHGTILHAGNVVEELCDFFRAEYDGQCGAHAHAGETMLAPGHLERDQIDKLHSGSESVDALRRHLPLIQQIELVLPDRFQVQLLRAQVVILCEIGDVMDVTSLCGGCEATQQHVLDKPLSQRCHSGSFGLECGYGNNRFQFGGCLAPRHYRAPQTAPYRGRSAPDTAKRFSSTAKVEYARIMPCLLALVVLAFPRVILVLMWLFSNTLDRAYHGLIIPLLGFIFLPIRSEEHTSELQSLR